MRLIDLQPAQQDLPAAIAITVGDVLKFAASGGHVRGGEAVELLGIFSAAAVGTDGSLLTPAGPPSVVLFLASRPGTATVDVVSGDPFHAPHPITLEVSVQP
jgi:hypothetical protein